MSNILYLSKFGPLTTFFLNRNSDWIDSIMFTAPGQSSDPVTMVGSIVLGSSLVTVGSTVGLSSGMPIQPIKGIPAGTYVGTITSSTQFSMYDIDSNSVNCTFSNAEAQLVFEPVPLDITGIYFGCQVRKQVGDPQVYIQANVSNGKITNGGKDGVISFNVPFQELQDVWAGEYVIDIVAEAEGHILNLFPEGPGKLVMSIGVTTP